MGRVALLALFALLLLVTVAATGYDLATSGPAVAPPPLDTHGAMVRTGDVMTHYERWGTSGTPIVLVPGFLEPASVWSLVGPRLAAAGHRVYAIDVRGFGYTQRHGPYTLAGDAAQLQAFLVALHLDDAHGGRPVLVGHSSGAAIVTDVARLAPASLRRIVLLDGDGTPYGVGPGWVHRLFVDPYATAVIRFVTRHPSFAAHVYRQVCRTHCPPFDPNQWLRPFRVAGAEAALKTILQRPLIGLTYAQERQAHVPAAIVYGSRDPEMTRRDAEATAARLHASITAIPGAGHLDMLSDPAATAAVLAPLSAAADR